VVGFGVHLAVQGELAAQGTLGKHAANGLLKGLGGMALDELGERDFLKATGETGMPIIHLVLVLAAGHLYLSGIDYDNVIADLLVSGKKRLVLAAEQVRYLDGHATEALTLGVDNEPRAGCLSGLYE